MKRFPPPKPPRQWRGTTSGSTRAWRAQRARIIMRDGGRCTHIDAYGERCAVRLPARLEVHHLNRGVGLAAADHELATRCPRHNPRGAG